MIDKYIGFIVVAAFSVTTISVSYISNDLFKIWVCVLPMVQLRVWHIKQMLAKCLLSMSLKKQMNETCQKRWSVEF